MTLESRFHPFAWLAPAAAWMAATGSLMHADSIPTPVYGIGEVYHKS